ncbi:hypothetical protein DY000_02005543 [Brassica cretica]|uniref:Uncharacterized protein n=1 Tax=Brassica cretica TaxID=69181 RepID=A0ABQ7CJG5_BRACR|nr:hypothetical protein DY000_02005543 [Brassica cretica]
MTLVMLVDSSDSDPLETTFFVGRSFVISLGHLAPHIYRASVMGEGEMNRRGYEKEFVSTWIRVRLLLSLASTEAWIITPRPVSRKLLKAKKKRKDEIIRG